MADVPSFFTRVDFWITLLPGYISILLGLFLLSPQSFSSMLVAGANMVNLLSAIMFIVAGPAIGFIIWQFYISAIEFAWSRFWHQHGKKYEFLREYSRLRSCCQDKERSELDEVNAQYQFVISTGIAVIIIAFLYSGFYIYDLYFSSDYLKFDIYHLDFSNKKIPINNASESSSPTSIQLQKVPEQKTKQLQELNRLQCNLQHPFNKILSVPLFVVPSILLIGGFYYNRGVRLPFICELMEQYPSIQDTQICRERKISRPEAVVIINGKQKLKPNEKIPVRPGQTFTLDGSNSYDNRYDLKDKKIHFAWDQIHGPLVLDPNDENSKVIKIDIPSKSIIGQIFSFRLIVSNSSKTRSKPFIINFEAEKSSNMFTTKINKSPIQYS